ncbi:TPA: DUF551 domain-containing protein [Klebsiella pneumoniae]
MIKSTITRARVVTLIAEHSYDSALVEALEHLLATMDSEPAPVVQKTAHSSVIAEQLANVLSEMKVTDHQRAVISCAVDRLNNVAQLLQLSPSALLVPEILDYQGAKELYNYLMTEEETNATVNGWNACRATMLQASPVCTCPSGDGSLRWPCPVHAANSPANPGCWCRACRPVVLNDMRFVVCPDCGNKRCPRANDHRNACTGSNESGQEGSAYQDTPQLPGSEPATVPGKWIPVSERMPDDDDFVYIWPRPDFGVELHVGQYCERSHKGGGWYAQVYEQNYGIEWHPITVTHWMPLPAGPQGVKGE